MNIVVFGSTPLALYLANKLSNEEHNIIVVDFDGSYLERVASSYDIGIKVASRKNWEIFEELVDSSPDMILAMSDDDETNLVLCDICKSLGYPFSVVKVEKPIYMDQTKVNYERLFRVDHFIAPSLLAAFDIFEKITNPCALQLETFSHGSVQMRSCIIPDSWEYAASTLEKLPLPNDVRISLIKRSGKILFPHGRDKIQVGDEIIILGSTDAILNEVPLFFKLVEKRVESVVIVGASSIGLQLASLLESSSIHVRIIDKDLRHCRSIASEFERADIIHHDAMDFDFLLMEQVHLADAFITTTYSDELNLLIAGLAKKAGCENVIALTTSAHIKSNIEGLEKIQEVSAFYSVTRRIRSIIQQRSFVSIASIYENKAEIVEMKVSKTAKTVGIRLSELSLIFPQEFLILAIESRGYLQIASGNSVFCPGDTVIAITNGKNRTKMEALF